MAKKKYQLTWQKGTGSRPGRWKKIIGGEVHYFDGGRGKTDRNAYLKALAEFQELKRQFLASKVKPFAAEYQECIDQWATVLAWCEQNEDQEMAGVAKLSLEDLNARLSKSIPEPPKFEDRYFSRTFREFRRGYSGEQDLDGKLLHQICLLYTSPSPRDKRQSRMPSSA